MTTGFNFADLFSKVNSGINKSPNQFAILADMIGSRINPSGAFAGIGQQVGQANLMREAFNQQKNEDRDFFKTLLGGAPTVPTPAGQDGIDSYKVTTGPNGESKITVNATSGLKKPNENMFSIQDLFSGPF
jgi:hypothetical protein